MNQRLLDLFQAPEYLEVGVEKGITFHAVKAARKVAVDPKFQFDVAAAKADPINAECEYHQVESDVYFSDLLEEGRKFDVIFLDGLHTFEQTLKDLMNALCCLKEDGLIVIDDVMPNSYAASISDLERTLAYHAVMPNEGTWMGDVYRLVFFINQYLPFFSYATMGENLGQLVMWKQRRPSTGKPAMKVEAISRLEYVDAVMGRELFNITTLADLLSRIPAAPTRRGGAGSPA